MSVEGIRNNSLVKIIVQPHFTCHLGDVIVYLPRIVHRPSLSFCKIFIHTFARLRDAVRVKLKALPLDSNAIFTAELLQCKFKSALADITEGAHDGRPDFNLQRYSS